MIIIITAKSSKDRISDGSDRALGITSVEKIEMSDRVKNHDTDNFEGVGNVMNKVPAAHFKQKCY